MRNGVQGTLSIESWKQTENMQYQLQLAGGGAARHEVGPCTATQC